MATTWLRERVPLLASRPSLLNDLAAFEAALQAVQPRSDAGGPGHKACRRAMAAAGWLDVSDDGVRETLQMFVCGWHDADLRDAGHLAHAALLTGRTAERPHGGRELVGLAMTGPSGGSRWDSPDVCGVPLGREGWQLNGMKTYISRLYEADAFVVTFNDQHGRGPYAALVNAGDAGLDRVAANSIGLRGWSWGTLHVTGVAVKPNDMLGGGRVVRSLLQDHFAWFRPAVGGLATGCAAAAVREAESVLAALTPARRPRESALVVLAVTEHSLVAHLLSCLNAAWASANGHSSAATLAARAKAQSVEAAWAALSELALLVGATSADRDHSFQKRLADLQALRYADGIRDELLRASTLSGARDRAADTPAFNAA